MPRGGRRAGSPGAKYPNRSDLAMAPRTAPIVEIPGQGYGAQAAQVAAQRTIPTGSASAPPQPSPMPGQGLPLSPVDLNAPTQRPDEPVTAGLPSGPGAGPEALGLGYGGTRLADLLSSLGQQSNAVAELAAFVNDGRR